MADEMTLRSGNWNVWEKTKKKRETKMADYLTPLQVAETLAVCRNTAAALMLKMPHLTMGSDARRVIRVERSAFERWLREQTQEPEEPRKRGRKPRSETNELKRLGLLTADGKIPAVKPSAEVLRLLRKNS